MIRKLFIILNIIAAVLLLVSCSATMISPERFWPLSFIAFSFPLLLLLNVLFIILWILFRSFAIGWSVVAILLSWHFTTSVFAFHENDKNQHGGIKVMSWNVKNFDLYNWSHNRETRNKIMALIKKEDPDILCLQEFYSDNDKILNNLSYISDTIGYPYCCFLVTNDLIRKPGNKKMKKLWNNEALHMQWGVATFSKFPIENTGRISFPNSKTNDCGFADLVIDSIRKLRVYNVHLQSVHLGYDDYKTIDEITETQSTSWPSLRNIFAKMKQAYRKRAVQADALKVNVAAFSGRKIIAGDFNDIPVSYVYQVISENMKDAFVEKGHGFGTTFANKLSVFRIDYLLMDPALTIHSYRSVDEKLSDHYPVISTFSY